MVPDVPDDAEFKREVPAPRRAGRAALECVIVRGAGAAIAAGGAAPTLPVLAELDMVLAEERARPIMGGVDIRGVPGLDVLGVVGFDHELKKSSSVSSFASGTTTGSIPSTAIPLGNLSEKRC